MNFILCFQKHWFYINNSYWLTKCGVMKAEIGQQPTIHFK